MNSAEHHVSRSRKSVSRKSLYAKLKPGPGRSGEEVAASQRARLRRAMIELSAERGYEKVTVRSITRLAGVSTRTFYKHFANAEECFVDTYESVMQGGLRRAYAAQRGIEDWERAIRTSLRTLLVDMASDPKAARLVLVEAFAVGPGMQGRMREEIAGFEQFLIDSFAGAPPGLAPPREVVGGIVAGVMRVARTRLLGEESTELDSLATQLGDWMLSFPGRFAPAPKQSDREPFGSLTRRNGSVLREDPSPALLGRPGDEEGRILSATAKLGVTAGFSALTVPRIRAEAGVSRRSFDARFAGVEDCFLEAIESIVASAATRAEDEVPESIRWESWVRTKVETLCTEVSRNPLLARLTLVDIFAPGREGLLRKERLISLGVERIRGLAPPERRPSELVAEASAAATWRIAHTEIATDRPGDLARLAPLVAYVTLAPVIGPVGAAEAIGGTEQVRVS